MSPPRAERDHGDRSGERGQAVYEFAILVPVFLLMLLGMLEFGFMFVQNQTLEYASREGARAGAAMANGSLTDNACVAGGGTVGAANVDPLIIDAVQRVLESSGSQVDVSKITNIVIYDANSAGDPIAGTNNTWTWVGPGSGALVKCQVPPLSLDFSQGAVNWSAANRNNGANGTTPDSIGVSITYTYQFRTPLGRILGFFGSSWSSLTMTDRSVMALEPTN